MARPHEAATTLYAIYAENGGGSGRGNGGGSGRGKKAPVWGELPELEQAAWEAVARRVSPGFMPPCLPNAP